jgi:hypothetical protein
MPVTEFVEKIYPPRLAPSLLELVALSGSCCGVDVDLKLAPNIAADRIQS